MTQKSQKKRMKTKLKSKKKTKAPHTNSFTEYLLQMKSFIAEATAGGAVLGAAGGASVGALAGVGGAFFTAGVSIPVAIGIGAAVGSGIGSVFGFISAVGTCAIDYFFGTPIKPIKRDTNDGVFADEVEQPNPHRKAPVPTSSNAPTSALGSRRTDVEDWLALKQNTVPTRSLGNSNTLYQAQPTATSDPNLDQANKPDYKSELK